MIAYEPLPRQRVAHGCPADEILFGGVKGGSKTDALVMKPGEVLSVAQRKFEATGQLQRCMMVLFRKTLQNESRDIITRTRQVYPLWDPKAKWNDQQKTWTFESGANVTISHLHAPDDYQRWDGVELVGVGVDQAEKCLPFEVFKFFTGQNRHSDPDYSRLKWIFLTANPGGPYAGWLWDYFIGETPTPEEKYQTWEVAVKNGAEVIRKSKAFIISRLSDNPYYYNSGEYEATLRSMTPEQQKWYIEGDWSQASGGFFGSLVNSDVQIAPALVPRRWELTFAIQFDPLETVILFAVRSPQNRIYFIDEMTMPGQTALAVGRELVAKFRTHEWDAALKGGEKRRKHDDQIGFVNPEAEDAGWAMSSVGMRVCPSGKYAVSGWRQMRERLGANRLRIFRDRCPTLTRQLSRAQPSAKDPNDVDDGAGENVSNKALNAARMICQAWPWSAKYEMKADESDWDEMMKRMNRPRTQKDEGMSAGYGD